MEPTRDCKDVACGRLPVGHHRMPLMAPFSTAIMSKFEKVCNLFWQNTAMIYCGCVSREVDEWVSGCVCSGNAGHSAEWESDIWWAGHELCYPAWQIHLQSDTVWQVMNWDVLLFDTDECYISYTAVIQLLAGDSSWWWWCSVQVLWMLSHASVSDARWSIV